MSDKSNGREKEKKITSDKKASQVKCGTSKKSREKCESISKSKSNLKIHNLLSKSKSKEFKVSRKSIENQYKSSKITCKKSKPVFSEKVFVKTKIAESQTGLSKRRNKYYRKTSKTKPASKRFDDTVEIEITEEDFVKKTILKENLPKNGFEIEVTQQNLVAGKAEMRNDKDTQAKVTADLRSSPKIDANEKGPKSIVDANVTNDKSDEAVSSGKPDDDDDGEWEYIYREVKMIDTVVVWEEIDEKDLAKYDPSEVIRIDQSKEDVIDSSKKVPHIDDGLRFTPLQMSISSKSANGLHLSTTTAKQAKDQIVDAKSESIPVVEIASGKEVDKSEKKV